MDILKIIVGIVLIGFLPSFWVFLGGASLASFGSLPGILLLILWIGLLFFGVKLIVQGISEN